MEEFETSNENVDALVKKFAMEKNDIVCGFLKEKEMIEMMHQEEVNNLVEKFEQEKENMRNEFELEKKDLLQGFHTQQVEKINEFEREQESLKAKHANEYHLKERKMEMKSKEEKTKIRREFEEIIAEKNEEIKMLRRELLRIQHNGDSCARTSPDGDVYIKRIEHEDELKRARENFDVEKLEVERKCDREKAELVQVFTNQTERMNANFEEERQRMQDDHQKELEFKLDVTERLLSEKSNLERKRMIQQFEREIGELQESLEIGCKEKLLEKQEAIDDLEKEKQELLNALQIERFSLAQVYNREISLLTNSDQLTKEDVEVALIDEIAKLKQQHDEALIEMDGQHKQKIEVIKRGQQPIKELENKHRKEIENLKKQYENEKESLEAEFRQEQFNLLKSFEFERNDLEQRYEEIINEKELEIQQREEDMRQMYEGELNDLKKIVEEQREELEISKQKLGDLAGEMEEFASEKNRMEENFYKENNQCQNLEQTIQNNLRAFEKNMKEAEASHQKELASKIEEVAKEKDELREHHENEKMDLRREIEILKKRLEELQKPPENVIVATSESALENDLVENNAGDVERSYITASNESKPVENKSSLGEKTGEEGQLDETENDVDLFEKTEDEEGVIPQKDLQQEVNKCLQRIREGLRECMPDVEKEDTLEDLRMSNKQLKEAINQAIVEIDKLCHSKTECDEAAPVRDQTTFSLDDQFLALDDILKEDEADEERDKSGKDQLKEKIKEILNNANRSHEVEKLQLREKHQEEINELLKELADEKRTRAQEALVTLKRLQELNQSDVKSPNCVTIKVTEDKGTLTDDLDIRNNKSSHENTKRDNSENGTHSPSDTVEELRQEKEEMKRSFDELEKIFTKDKEDLMEKLQTQHKEFVMSAEGEIIENLLKQKSTLEEAFNLERFYLGRLYYLEMKDELESILNRKKEEMKRDYDRDKMDIILKYEKDIADLHSLLSEKGEMELRLLQDKNEALKKLLATQKRSAPEKGKAEKRRKSQDQLEREKENLEITIPLKKEIADLQNKRQQEHEAAVANLKNAIDLINEILSGTPSISQRQEQQLDRSRFISEDPTRSVVPSPFEKSELKTSKRLLVSEDEIRNREELKAALENLVELVLNDDEDSVYDSETTSGASSDLESDDSGPTTVNGESDEGAYSGPESTDGDTLNIKKAQLDFEFNLERFNLSRVYYGEYRESLKKVMRKLAKTKDSLRSKRKDLENDMLSGIKNLVDRTHFGEESTQVFERDIEKQTSEIDEIAVADHEHWLEDDIDGKRLTEIKKTDNRLASISGDNEAAEFPQIDMENDQEGKANRNFEDKSNTLEEKPAKLEEYLDHSPKDENIAIKGEPQEKVILGDENNHEDPHRKTELVLSEDKHDGPSRKEKGSGRLPDGQHTKEQRDKMSPSTEFTANQEPQYSTEKERDPEAGNKLSDAPIENQHSKGDILTEAADTPDKGSGVEGKRKDDESMKKPPRNEETIPQAGKEEASRENTDEKEEGDKEQRVKTENWEDEVEVAADYTSLGQSEEKPKDLSGETSWGINDKDNHEEQAAKEDHFTRSGYLDDNEGENAEDGQNGDGGESLIDEDFEKDRNENPDVKGKLLTKAEDDDNKQKVNEDDKIPPDEKSNKGITEGEACEDGKGSEKNVTDHKDKVSEEKPSIHKGDAPCKTLDEKDEAANDQEVKHREAEKGNLPEASTDDYTDAKVEPEAEQKSLDSSELNMDFQPSRESQKGEILERNKEDKNSEKASDADKNDISDDENLSDMFDVHSRIADVNDDDELSLLRGKSPVYDQDLIKQLNVNNKILQDKFNLLCELVGKEFVDEIPELKNGKGKDKDLATLGSLNDLYAENEQLTDELKQVDAQIKELIETGSDQLRDLNKRLNDEEMKLLHSLGEIEKHLKRNDDKELTEHLLKEKEDVCTKLDEINNLLNEQKEEMEELGSKDDKTVPGLMCKTDVLKDELNEKAQQLSYKNKMLEAATSASEKEKETFKNSLNSLKLQLAALEDGIPESEYDGYPYSKRQSNKELPLEILSLVKSNTDAENEREKLEKEIKKIEREIERCCRMLEERSNRLKPFQRKRARIEESLDLADSLPSNEGEKVSKEEHTKDQVEDTPNIDSDATREKQGEIEKKIKELDFAMCKLELPCELEQERTEDIPTAEKLGIVYRFKDQAEEDLKCLEREVAEEQNKLREAGFRDPIKLTQHLEEKEKLSKERAKLDPLAVDGSSSVTEQYPDVKQLETLLTQKEHLEEKILKLDGQISDEQQNFIDGQQFKRTGKVNEDSESNIKVLIEIKENLLTELKDTNEKILKSLSTGGLRGPQTEFLEEFVERKVKLEDEIEKLQDKIDDETSRAAEALVDLLELKAAISKELRNTTESASEEVQRLQESISDDDNKTVPEKISEFISQALITLDPKATPALTEEIKELYQTQKIMEDLVKEDAENLTEAKRKGQDPLEIERALEHAIKEKITVDSKLQEMDKDGRDGEVRKDDERPAKARKLEQGTDGDGNVLKQLISDNTLVEKPIQDTLEDENERSETKLPLAIADENYEADTAIGNEQLDERLQEKRKELEESLYQIENRLNIMLQDSDPSNELKKDDLENIEALAAKKVKLQEDLQQAQLFEDFLNEKDILLQEQHRGQEASKDSYQRKMQLESELKKLIEMIDRRESEVQKIETQKDAKEKQLKQLNNDKEELDEKLQPLKETVKTAKKEVEAALEDMQTNIREHEECSNEEQVALQQELEVLQNEIEQGKNELQEVEKELIRLKKEFRQNKDAIPADVLDLEKLLIEKENLRDYLAEIDATLDKNYERDPSEQENPANIEELREQKRELKLKLDDIQNEKGKLLVEFEDEEMNEVMDGLAQRKRELELRKEEISDEIRGSGVVSRLARKRKKNGYEMPRYYIHDILTEMARDEKTLTELIKEQEDSKIAAQTQSELLGKMVDLVNSNVGENLVNSLTALDLEDIESKNENQHQAVIDEIKANGATVSDILIEISAENKQLRDINGELSSDLEMVKEKIGVDLVDALLSESLPVKESEFEDVVNAVQEEEQSLASILREQKGKIDLVGDILGKDLLRSILDTGDTSKVGHKPDSGLEILAPAIMRKYDEDLENVIAVYEKELDNLSRENSLLKEKLGKDLSRALLKMSAIPETPLGIDIREQDMSSGIQDGKSALYGRRLEEKRPSLEAIEESEDTSQEDTDGDNTPSGDTDSNIEKERKGKNKRKVTEGMKGYGAPKLETNEVRKPKQQRSLSEELLTQDKDIDHLEDKEILPTQNEMSDIEQNKIFPGLDSIVASHFASPAYKHLPDLTEEEDGIVKGPLNAPLIMRASGNTLGEVIAQYERNLGKPVNEIGTREAAMGEESSTIVIGPGIQQPDDICEVNETMEGIVEAQEKNMEMLNVLKTRLGNDLVQALINETEEDHLDDLVNDDVTANDSDNFKKQAEIAEPQQEDKQTFEKTYITAPENEEVFLAQERPADVTDDKGIVLHKNLPGEDAANRRILRAPNIALENKKTLADVIASYEDGLDSLRSKIGPSLTNTLLSMETPSNVEIEEGGDQGRRKASEIEFKQEELNKGREEELDKENDLELTEESPELFSTEGEKSLEKELRAPEIMATSGKTLEEVIEDYEERINEEIKHLQKQVGLLKEKLGNSLYHTLLAHPDFEDEQSPINEITDQGYPNEREQESVKMQSAALEQDLKAKSLLQDEGKTVENILRKYERQIDELSKLVPGENDEGVSILELTSTYEDKISDLEKENEAFADRLANLSNIIGRNLLHRLENMEDEDNQKTEDGDDGGEEDVIKAPKMMQIDDQTLEKVVRSYEKELDVLRKLLSNQGEDASITDIVRDYEEKIHDLESKNNNVQNDHDELVNRIGRDLVHDILALMPPDSKRNYQSDEDLSKQPAMSEINNASQLNAPVIMKRDDDSSLQDVLELYEKALGLLPGPPNDDSFVGAKICKFDDLKRENEILKKALGDGLATDLIAIAEEETPPTPTPTPTTEMKPMSYLPDSQKIKGGELKGRIIESQNTPDSAKTREHLREERRENGMPVSFNEEKLDALELVRDEDRTIENIVKNYEKELEALRNLVPSEKNEGVSVMELMKDYEDRIEKLENDKKNLLEMSDNLEKNIGPGLMDDLQNLYSSYKESGIQHGKKPSDLAAPILMKNENRTLEGVLRNYENELEVLRKLAPDQGEEGGSISDIVKDYEDKLKNLVFRNNALKHELRGLREKIGDGLFNDLQFEVSETERAVGVSQTSEKGDDDDKMKIKRILKATEILNETQQPLEDILATYEQDLDDLQRENKVYKDGIGKGLAEALLQMAPKEDSCSYREFEGKELEAMSTPSEKLSNKFTPTGESQDVTGQPSQSEAVNDDTGTETDELKATSLLRDEGEDVETILKKYEKELDALRKITAGETEDGISVSDLVGNYQNKVETLEGENKHLTEKLHNLEDTIGEDLYAALDSFKEVREKDDDKDNSSGKEMDINVVNVMKNEDRNLEDVVNNYEKELLALRKLVPSEGNEKCSISDVINEYEGKIKELQRQNEDLKITLDQLEDNIGSNLFEDLKKENTQRPKLAEGGSQEAIKEPESPETMKANNERVLPLEKLLAIYEQDLDEKAKENRALKDSIGQRLAKCLLNLAAEKEIPSLVDSQKESQENVQDGEEPSTSTSPSKEIGRASQPFDNNNNNKEDVSSLTAPNILKAESLIGDEGKTVENVLEKYEKELETLSKLLPTHEGISIPDLVAKYEDIIDTLKKENEHLASRLDNIEQKIGTKLLNEVENGEPEEVPDLKDEGHGDDLENKLIAPGIMRNEERTLENVVKTYEQELDALRSLVPSDGDEGRSITDIVKTYEDLVDQLKAENESSKKDSERLVKRIGLDLVQDIKKLEEINSEVAEGAIEPDLSSELESRKQVKDLKVTKIMDVKKSTLEDVLETYENALGILLSGASSPTDELNVASFIADYDSPIEELKEENDIFRKSIGPTLSQRLLDIVRDDDSDANKNVRDNGEPSEIVERESDSALEESRFAKASKYPTYPRRSQRDDLSDNLLSPEELKAESLIKEEGRTIENILKNYEKQLEVLKSLIPDQPGQPADNISDLVLKYEDEIDGLKNERSDLTDRLGFLEEKLGQDLMADVESQKLSHKDGSKDSFDNVREAELQAPLIMAEENRTLETVINCYEKELDALRKLVSNQENGQQVSISDIIKDYEDKIDEVKHENNTFKLHFDALTDRLGSNLANDIKRLNKEGIGSDESSEVESEAKRELKTAESEKRLKAPNLMRINNSTLESVLETYEDALGFNNDNNGLSYAELDKTNDTDTQLQHFEDLQEENKAFISALGENLAQNILEAAKADDRGDPIQGTDGAHGRVLTELTEKRRSSSATEGQGRRSLDIVTQSDDLKAKALLRDNENTIEDILRNYEKEIEALSKLIPNETDGSYSISDLVKDYEDKLENLQTENSMLGNKLESLRQSIGQGLVKDLENPLVVAERKNEDLKAPLIMQKEGKTLENIVRKYEKELEAFRKADSGDDESPSTITDIVNEYEDKIDELKIQNESLKDEFDCLKERIGLDLAEDIMSIESKAPGEENASNKTLKYQAAKIMQVKETTLADVLESYETELASTPGDEILNTENMEILKEKVGSELINELLLLQTETESGMKQKWKAVEKIEEEKTTLADILETYEQELERLKREKSAIEALINDNGSDGQSALDIISQYEDEIEHLKHQNKEMEKKISTLIARMGDDLVNDLLSLRFKKKTTLRSSLKALEIMEDEEKQLSAVLQQYENEISKLSRENEAFKAVVNRESLIVNGDPLTTIVSDYERKIQELLDEKQDTEANLRVLSDGVGRVLANEIVSPDETGETLPLDALKIMNNERKTLAEVTKQYESDLERMEKEISAMQSLVSGDLEKSSFVDKISEYEDEISKLKNKIRDQTLLEKKVGLELAQQLTTLGENREEDIVFRAVEDMARNNDTTLADILKDYEKELEKKDHEILTLKELVSGDILAIATSQESEIDELKNVKKILANELDLISDKVGKELVDEIMNRSNQQPTTESRQFYHNTVERMENEGKSLADILEEYEKEIKAMRSENEELTKKEDALTKVSDKIGKDLLNEILAANLPESYQTEIKPLFEASVLMVVEEKTLGEIILNYEKELDKLERENGALRALTEKGGFEDSSALEVFSEYEEKIEKLRNENLECNKRMQKLTVKVGVELTEELLKLPDGVDLSLEPINEIQALRTLKQNQTTLAHVLQTYENRLKKEGDAGIGLLGFGKPITENVKLAQIVHVDENEPVITISEDERPPKSKYLEADEPIALEKSTSYPTYLKETPSDGQDRINTLVNDNKTLRAKLGKLSKKVGTELAEELMRSQEDDSNDVKAAVAFSSVRDLDAFNDVVTERVTLAQVLESYEKQLKRPLQVEIVDINGPLVESRIVKEDIKRTHLVRANESEPTDLTMTSDQILEEDVCEIGETDVVSRHPVPNFSDAYLVQGEATSNNVKDGLNDRDDRRNADLGDLDLSALEDLILSDPKIMVPKEESPLSLQGQEVINEEIISVELSRHEEHFNLEYMEKLFGEELPVVDQGDQCEIPDSKLSEKYLTETKAAQSSGNEKDELESLKTKVKELEKDLEEEKNLKEKYSKDVQDLLQDIVDLKMKQADDDDGQKPEETRTRIKEDIELKHDNKRLHEDLRKEKKRRLSIEESKRDLLDELESLMREKELLLNQQNDNKDNEKLLEDMINLRKKLGELDTENKRLKKEVKELKEASSEVVVTHEDEKNKLLAECEKEKSEMMEELVASKRELETQLQELLAMNDDLKGTINNLQEELKESSERLSTEGDVRNESESSDTQKDINDEDNASLLQKLKQEGEEKERKFLYEKEKNEKLKEQLDETENALKQTLTKYQDEIKSIETENAKKEDELRKEIEILANKLHLEKASAEQQRNDFENILQRDKERLKEDIATEHERQKMKLQHDVEDKEEELNRQGKRRSAEFQTHEEQWKKEREELQDIFRVEKEKLQKTFDDELKRKLAENDDQHKQRNEEMTMEMNRKLAKEKKEIKATIEKKIYEQLLDKNIAAETDFQEVLSKILQEHSKEIENVENDIRKAEERFKEDKNKLLEQNDSEKEALKKMHEEEKKALESTIQNLLKEVVKLKQQRKEIRIIHKKEKETMEEIYERDRIKLKEDWEQYKRDLLSKLQEDFDNKLANETKKLETKLEDLKQELEKSEHRRKELEDRLKGNAIDSDQARAYDDDKGGKTEQDDEAHSRELRSVKKTLEEEYDKKLKEEKRKFEETLQGLRREIGNLQEKRRLIQDRIYNQDPSLVDRNLVEKSIANYKMEMLSKIDEEVTQKIAREKKPLEETIKEQQLEIDELKRQRWELRNQLRRERSKLEEEFEVERERMENQFLKEKEELKNKLETRLQREMTKRTMEEKVSRALSPITNVSISTKVSYISLSGKRKEDYSRN